MKSRTLKKWMIIASLWASCATSVQAVAGQFTVTWDPNSEPDLAGYRLWSVSTLGTNIFDAGKITSFTYSNLVAGVEYLFFAKAYNTLGLESGPSDTVQYTPPPPPSITGHPLSWTGVPGSTITLNVIVAGAGPLEFQWFRSGVPLQNANSATLMIPHAHKDHSGTYYVRVSNPGGVVSSHHATVTVLSSQDTDQDGIPDDFELAAGLDPENSEDGALDLDGDRFSNYEEFLAGTNPTDPRSVLRILPQPGTGLLASVDFQSVAGKTYYIEQNSSFPFGPWELAATSEVGPIPVAMLTAEEGRRIYRVRTTGANGESVSSEVAGVCSLDLLGGSDTLVSMPFSRHPAQLGAIHGVEGNTVRLRGSPDWLADQWAYSPGNQTNTYYLLVRSGPAEGEYYTILGNSGDALTLDTGGMPVALNPGDAVAIIPYWTLGTIFPAGLGVHASPTPGNRRTEVLFPNLQGTGINLSAAATYYFWNGVWLKVGEGSAVQNDDVVLPDMYVVVRHKEPASTLLLTEGVALKSRLRVRINRTPTGKHDNALALPRPFPVSLDDSGLISSGAFRTSSSPAARTDELLVFDNRAAGKNRAAAVTYYHWNGAWRRVGGGVANAGHDLVFEPGTGVILRSGPGQAPITWENVPGF